MAIRITLAQSGDADVIATMVGELLHEIMAAVKDKASRKRAASSWSRMPDGSLRFIENDSPAAIDWASVGTGWIPGDDAG